MRSIVFRMAGAGQQIPKVCAFLKTKNPTNCCKCTVPHDLCIGLELLMLTLQFSRIGMSKVLDLRWLCKLLFEKLSNIAAPFLECQLKCGIPVH